MKDAFLECFVEKDVPGARALLAESPVALANRVHPWLLACVAQNHGHCHEKGHLEIAEMLLPEMVLAFRDAVVDDQVDDVTQWLCQDHEMVEAEFVAGRGIGRALHHCQSAEMIEVLLQVGADIDALNSLQESPLTLQLRMGTLASVQYLLERGANPNLGVAPHLPSETMSERIGLLRQHGWDIHQGQQLLHDAKHGHGKRVLVWLDHGVDANLAREDGKTALHLLAAVGKGKEAVQALLEAGANLEALDAEGLSPLEVARQGASSEVVNLLQAR